MKNAPATTLEKGGKGSITEQLLNARADVTLGGGAKTFAETATTGEWQGKTLREQAQARGYQLVSDAASLAAITDAGQDKPLLGLFAEGNMPVRWEGPKASYHGNLDKPPVTCTPNPQRNDSVPTLAAMTDKAISLLSKNEKGFFLQVEGASIDKQDHAANPCGQIGETVDLDEAVQKALAFAKQDGNTLVIVTADHAHSSQIVRAGYQSTGVDAGADHQRRCRDGDELRQRGRGVDGAYWQPAAYRGLRSACRQCDWPDGSNRSVLHHASRVRS